MSMVDVESAIGKVHPVLHITGRMCPNDTESEIICIFLMIRIDFYNVWLYSSIRIHSR